LFTKLRRGSSLISQHDNQILIGLSVDWEARSAVASRGFKISQSFTLVVMGVLVGKKTAKKILYRPAVLTEILKKN
jgi:hypothetical protein